MAKLEKLIISAFKDEKFTNKAGSYTVMLNPASYQHGHKIAYNDDQGQNSSKGAPIFQKMESETISIEVILDTTGVLGKSNKTIADQIKDLKKLVLDYDGKIHEIKFLTLSWGTLYFKCRLESMDIEYSLFKPDGTPIRAKIKMGFLEYMSQSLRVKEEKKSSPDLSHVRTIREGDTLPMLCHEIYGDSNRFLEVAKINNLMNFRNLKAGTVLYFPPIKK